MISRYRTCISTYLLGISDCFLAGLSIGKSLILLGEFPGKQEKVPSSCFQLPVGSRDGVAVLDLDPPETIGLNHALWA